MNQFDPVVTGAFEIAQMRACEGRYAQLCPEHLMLGLMKHPSSYTSHGLKKYESQLEQLLKTLPLLEKPLSVEDLRPSSNLTSWLTYASGHALQKGKTHMAEGDLLRFLPQFLPALGVDPQDLSNKSESQEGEVPEFIVNLNEMAQKGKLDPVVGRGREIRSVMEILGRRNKNNPVLVGPAGVGKTAIVEGLAEAIVKDKVPEVLKGKTIYVLDLGSLMAGTQYRGAFEERLQKLIRFLKEQAGQAVIFIDEIHQLVGAGKTQGGMDAANLLKPALARGELNCIGATTEDEYQKYILADTALDRRFRAVPVRGPSCEEAIEILMRLKEKWEAHHGIKIDEEAIYSAVFLSDQYLSDKNLPDKAIDLVDEASAALKLSTETMPPQLAELEGEISSKKIRLQVESDSDKEEVEKEIKELEKKFKREKEIWEKRVHSMKKMSELKNQLEHYEFELEQAQRNADFERASKLKYGLIPEIQAQLENNIYDGKLGRKNIAQVIARQTGIPLEKILQDKQEHILKLEEFLKGRIFGQDKCLEEISETLLTAYAGLKDESRPLGSFLLKGPSGVGKTETAKSLAEFLFDSQRNMVRLDMSEYSEEHSVAKLMGSPAGYVGYEEGGILTEAVRRRPYCVILFDEIEKAHPHFSDILLQVLDDGRLTDNRGRTIDFKNTVIFLTTNSKNCEASFKPEVLGRLDSILEYQSLNPSIMGALVEKELKLFNHRLNKGPCKAKVFLDPFLEKTLIKQGFHPQYGARVLASTFNRLVLRPFSKFILKGEALEKELLARWNEIKKEVEFINPHQ